jgi:DNA polymerase-3 subunit beta
MKFVIETKTLSEALGITSIGVGRTFSLPILGSVLIEASDNKITFSTSSLETFMRHSCSAMVAAEGNCVLPHSLLSKLVGRLTSTRVTIKADNERAILTSGDVTAEFELLPVMDFPEWPKIDDGQVTVESEDIKTPFSMCEHAIMFKNQDRYTLCGINCEKGDFTAADGQNIANYKGREIVGGNIIIPDNLVRAVLQTPLKGNLNVSTGDGCIQFKSEETMIAGKLIEGTYPNWKQVVPGDDDVAFSCGTKPLIEALRTCSLFADGKRAVVTLRGIGKELEVAADNGKSKVILLGTELTNQPEAFYILDANRLLNMVGVLQEENVRLILSDRAVMVKERWFTGVLGRIARTDEPDATKKNQETTEGESAD